MHTNYYRHHDNCSYCTPELEKEKQMGATQVAIQQRFQTLDDSYNIDFLFTHTYLSPLSASTIPLKKKTLFHSSKYSRSTSVVRMETH